MRCSAILLAAAALAAGVAAQTTAAPTLDLAQALARARANSPVFQAALVAEGGAQAAHTQARAALLPSLNFNNSYLYTQGFRFIANNAVHEYVSQGDVHESLNFGSHAALRRAQAVEALARAGALIAARGLDAAVTGEYYGLLAADHKQTDAARALAQAQSYLKISQEREQGGEVAHADVIKAQLEVAQRQRELTEAGLAEQQARLSLAVMLFPQFNESFHLVDDLAKPPPLPAQARVQALAGQHNPALEAAQAGVNAAQANVTVARAGLLPNLALDYFYGIDAAQFAARNPLGQSNLASSASVTLNIPLFNWGANRAAVAQAQREDQQAGRELRFTQRQLQAQVRGFYAEAQAAAQELANLLRSRDLADESLQLTGLQYEAGDATILELVDAQNTDLQARNAYQDGLVRYRVARAQLQTLTGPF